MYNGIIAPIPLGIMGLMTDENQARIPATALTLANNITLRRNIIEKEPGSRRWNTTALPAGIVAACDFWPNDITQRKIVVTRDGRVLKFVNPASFVVLKTGLVITDPPVMVIGGAESAGRNRKVFIFTGNNKIQVLSGDADVLTDIALPPGDWASAYPTFGLINRSRLCVMGNSNSPHQYYMSDPANHENFQSNQLTFSAYPGEGEALFCSQIYKGRVYLFKYPLGAYYLEDSDSDFTKWYIKKISSSFGSASRHSAFEALDDMIIANSTGSLTSASATQAFGAIETGDILRALKCERFMLENMSQNGRKERQAIYYENRKLAYITYRSSGGIHNDRILCLDFNQQIARVTWGSKDQANCLFLSKDSRMIQRPYYGSEDGFIYEMEQNDRNVNGLGYSGEFKLPHMDFSFIDPKLGPITKLFDHLQVTFEETGNWDLSVDVYIDKEFVETINFPMTVNEYLNKFVLNEDDVTGRAPQSFTKPLHGSGKVLSFHCYNNNPNQNFKITELTVYFRPAGDNQGARTA